MKKLIALACLGLMFTAPAFAGAQQEKMKSCNMEAKEKALKGDERKSFMKSCLSKEGAPAAMEKKASTQQEKMKSCNKDAKTKALKGDERKKFMSECLKN